MELPRNSRSPAELFKGFDTMLRHYLWDRPRAQWHVIRARFQNLPQTNFDLGCQFAAQGKWRDAAFRFRFALYLQPNFVQARYNLGCCLMRLGRYDAARDAFEQVLRLDATHGDARFMLSAVAPRALPEQQLPKTMPPAMVKDFFTAMAPQYDQLATRNDYQGPRLVAEASRPFLKTSEGLHFVELGCGTGLVAKPWRSLCREIIGVDSTHAMVTAAQTARAGDNPAFDRVLEADINALEAGLFMPGASDVVVCIDTAQFLGDLAPAMQTAASALKAGGLFLVTIEPFAAERGFGVNPATGRFGHSVAYVTTLAERHGLRKKRDGVVPLYAQLNAHLFVFEKAVS